MIYAGIFVGNLLEAPPNQALRFLSLLVFGRIGKSRHERDGYGLMSVKPIWLSVAFACFLAWFTSPVFAQDTSSLQGRVLDAESRLTLPGATLLLTRNGVQIGGQATGPRGRFEFKGLSAGTYVLTASFVGFQSKTDTLDLPLTDRLDMYLAPVQTFLEEILVETQQLDESRFVAGLETIRPEDLSRVPMPDVSYDLAGYLVTLPGVVSTGDRGGQLFIRGGTPTQNLVLIDGMRVFQPFHVVGFYSAFPADIISYADVYAGGFNARYGGRISSVIDIKTRNGNKEKVEVSASVAPFLSGAQVSLPVRKGDTSVMLSVRESLIDRVSPGLLGSDLPFRFGDRYAKLHSYLNQTSSLTLTALQTHDEGNLATGGDLDPDAYRKSTWKNAAYGMKYMYLPESQAVMTSLSVYYSSLKSRYRPTRDELRTSDIEDVLMSIDFAYLLGPNQIHFGIFGNTNFFDYKLGRLGTAGATGVTSVGSFIEGQFQISDYLRIEPGARLEIFSRGLKNSFGPRLRLIFQPGGQGGHHQFSAAWGRYHQQIVGLNNEQDVSDVFTVWAASPNNTPVPKAMHMMAGWKGRPLPWLELTTEVYRKNLSSLSFPVFGTVINKVAQFSSVNGYAQGIDTKVEITNQDVFFSLSYSRGFVEYNRPFQRAKGIFRPSVGGATYLDPITFNPPHDRRDQVNIMFQYQLGANKLGVRWQYGSGLPFTQVNGYYAGLSSEVEAGNTDFLTAPGSVSVSRADPYGSRLPSYHRLDVTYERKKTFTFADVTAMVGLINAYDRANIFEYNIFTGNRVDQLPIIPSIGLRVDVQ